MRPGLLIGLECSWDGEAEQGIGVEVAQGDAGRAPYAL